MIVLYQRERVRPYWNDLPKSVRNVETVEYFKASLECYKTNADSLNPNNFWYISKLVIDKIEGNNYLANKEKFNQYLRDNPFVAKRKGINISL